MKGQNEITNSENTIDSRDIIDRIEYLENERDSLQKDIDTAQENLDDESADADDNDPERVEQYKVEFAEAKETMADWQSEYGDELKALTELADDASGYSSDWQDGETLVNESYWLEYVEQLAEDIGAIDRNAAWPLNHIDWEAAADELMQDFTEVSFNGTAYYMRNS